MAVISNQLPLVCPRARHATMTTNPLPVFCHWARHATHEYPKRTLGGHREQVVFSSSFSVFFIIDIRAQTPAGVAPKVRSPGTFPPISTLLLSGCEFRSSGRTPSRFPPRSFQGTMPGKAAVALALQPSLNVAPAAPQKSFPFVLKKIMDIPPPNILEEGDEGKL